MRQDELKITSQDIKNALKKKYVYPEWELCFEVGNGNGSRRNRSADAIAMNMFPSRNYETIGFEIKVSRNDLKKELEDGSKSDALAKYCNFWMLVVPKKLINDSILIPYTWGIMEYDKEKDKLRVVKKPEQLPEPILSKDFMAGMFRAYSRDREKEINESIERITQKHNESIKKEVEEKVKEKIRNTNMDYEKYDKIKEILGTDIWNLEKVNETYQIGKKLNKYQNYSFDSLPFLIQDLDNALSTAKNLKEEIHSFLNK